MHLHFFCFYAVSFRHMFRRWRGDSLLHVSLQSSYLLANKFFCDEACAILTNCGYKLERLLHAVERGTEGALAAPFQVLQIPKHKQSAHCAPPHTNPAIMRLPRGTKRRHEKKKGIDDRENGCKKKGR